MLEASDRARICIRCETAGAPRQRVDPGGHLRESKQAFDASSGLVIARLLTLPARVDSPTPGQCTTSLALGDSEPRAVLAYLLSSSVGASRQSPCQTINSVQRYHRLRHCFPAAAAFAGTSECAARLPRYAFAIVATTSAYPPPTGKVDHHQESNPPDRKRRLESRDTPLNPPRSPARRPGHVSSKSLTAIPTLSTINIVPFAPSPLGSPTTTRTAASSRASSRRPSAASGRSTRSWLGKSTANASTMASPYETANTNQGGPLSGAADLLRQAMMSGSQRYAAESLTYTRTHASSVLRVHFLLHKTPLPRFHMLHTCTTPTTSAPFLCVFASPPRAPPQQRRPPQQRNQQRICRDSTSSTLGRGQNDRRNEGTMPFAPPARNVGRTPAIFRVFFSRPLGHASVRPPQEI